MVKRTAMTLGLVATFAIGLAQGMPNMTPPKELKALKFMLGNWSGMQTVMMDPSGKPSKNWATSTSAMVMGGRYLSSNFKMPMGKMGNEDGSMLMTWDTKASKYRGWWFDNMSEAPMEFEGNLNGQTLVLVSKSTGAANEMQIRSTYSADRGGKLGFKLEMKAGPNWTPMIEGTFSHGKGRAIRKATKKH